MNALVLVTALSSLAGSPVVPVAQRAGARESVATVIARCVEAYGGRDALARAGNKVEMGRVTSLVLHPGDVGQIARAYSRPGRLRVEIKYREAPGEIRVLDGPRGWREGQEVSGAKLEAMILQAARLDLVAQLAEPNAKVEDRGAGEVDGRAVRVLAVRPGRGLVVEAHVDAANGRILRSRGSGEGSQMLAFETTYGDFRKVDGVLVPFHEWNWANGKTTGETVIEKVEFPKALPSTMFTP